MINVMDFKESEKKWVSAWIINDPIVNQAFRRAKNADQFWRLLAQVKTVLLDTLSKTVTKSIENSEVSGSIEKMINNTGNQFLEKFSNIAMLHDEIDGVEVK